MTQTPWGWDDPSRLSADDPGDPGWNGDGFGEFMSRASHPILSREQERSLAMRIATGRSADAALIGAECLADDEVRRLRRASVQGRVAADDLALHNIRLVVSIARRYRRQCVGALSLEDLVQEGYLGLRRATEKFDWRRGFKFSTYASWWVRQSITRAIANQSRTVRLPVHVTEEVRRFTQARLRAIESGAGDSDSSVATAMGVDASEVARLRVLTRDVVSLEHTLKEHGRNVAWIADSADVAQVAEDEAVAAAVNAAVDAAVPADADILRRRFGIGFSHDSTLEMIGTVYGLTRERIRQREARALASLRTNRHLRDLEAS